MVDVALFMSRLYLDCIHFSCRRHRSFVQVNAHLIPTRELAQISFARKLPALDVKISVQAVVPKQPAPGTVQSIEFSGTWDAVLDEKDLFRKVVRYTVPRHLRLGTP